MGVEISLEIFLSPFTAGCQFPFLFFFFFSPNSLFAAAICVLARPALFDLP